MSAEQGDYSHLLDWLQEREFVSRSEEETFRLAERLGSDLTGKEVVLLTGELGAGKTVFTKGLALGAGVSDVNCVCSPTFTLVNVYQGRQTLYHIDLYRLEKASEIEDLGWEDYIGTGIVVVEWAERLPFPVEGVSVRIEVGGDDARTISMGLRSP
jgi:tRNA threonylcarbamoyladenosine biosynthesis protein TsaE